MPLRSARLCCLFGLYCWSCLIGGPVASKALLVTPRRPSMAQWQRTQCASPTGSADIPSRWALEVSAAAVPLPEYPRPTLVRGVRGPPPPDTSQLRDSGVAGTWHNLNGLWEWEAAPGTELPTGRTLRHSILVPFPVESCLSGVAPRRTADTVQRMWCVWSPLHQ